MIELALQSPRNHVSPVGGSISRCSAGGAPLFEPAASAGEFGVPRASRNETPQGVLLRKVVGTFAKVVGTTFQKIGWHLCPRRPGKSLRDMPMKAVLWVGREADLSSRNK